MLLRALLPLLQKAAEVNAGGQAGRNAGRAAIVQVTSFFILGGGGGSRFKGRMQMCLCYKIICCVFNLTII
jgi:hypothetical protein